MHKTTLIRLLAALLCGGSLAVVASPARAQEGNFDPATATEGFEIGNLAPEIDGEDLDGVEFKLSDYRGKVVVLDFWGNW